MRIVSLNGWGGRLHDRLVAYIRDLEPDVLCLQEVVRTPDAPRPWLTYRDLGLELDQRANFLDDVAGALPRHDVFFCPAAQGELWDGDTAHASQWGLATFVRSGIPVIAQAQDFVHGCFSPYGYGEHPRARNAHIVRLFDFAAGRPITVAQMHGLRDLGGKRDTPDRLRQAERLAALVASIAGAGDGLVVCGDFNVLPGSRTFEVLRRLGLRDLVTGGGFRSTRTSWYAKPSRFADYMLVNDAVAVTHFAVVTEPEVSDHCPLLLETGVDTQLSRS